MVMRTFDTTVWWRVGAATFTVRAWTRKGAIKKARKVATTLKPKADLIGVTVR
jgi:hypothetical protein